MADTYKALTSVDTVTSVSDTDYVVVNDSGTVKQITKANLLSELTSAVSEKATVEVSGEALVITTGS